jgi:hypothetical protein
VLAVTANSCIGYAAFYAAPRDFPNRLIALQEPGRLAMDRTGALASRPGAPVDAGERRAAAAKGASSERENPPMPTNGSPTAPDEELPYSVQLWGGRSVERVLARAFNAALARAIFNAAHDEHPGRRIAGAQRLEERSALCGFTIARRQRVCVAA